MKAWIKNLSARNAGAKNESKADSIIKNSDICAKKCGCHYTVSQRGYPEHIKRKAIQMYLEGNEFGKIERLLKVSHVSVINWVKKGWCKIRESP